MQQNSALRRGPTKEVYTPAFNLDQLPGPEKKYPHTEDVIGLLHAAPIVRAPLPASNPRHLVPLPYDESDSDGARAKDGGGAAHTTLPFSAVQSHLVRPMTSRLASNKQALLELGTYPIAAGDIRKHELALWYVRRRMAAQHRRPLRTAEEDILPAYAPLEERVMKDPTFLQKCLLPPPARPLFSALFEGRSSMWRFLLGREQGTTLVGGAPPLPATDFVAKRAHLALSPELERLLPPLPPRGVRSWLDAGGVTSCNGGNLRTTVDGVLRDWASYTTPLANFARAVGCQVHAAEYYGSKRARLRRRAYAPKAACPGLHALERSFIKDEQESRLRLHLPDLPLQFSIEFNCMPLTTEEQERKLLRESWNPQGEKLPSYGEVNVPYHSAWIIGKRGSLGVYIQEKLLYATHRPLLLIMDGTRDEEFLIAYDRQGSEIQQRRRSNCVKVFSSDQLLEGYFQGPPHCTVEIWDNGERARLEGLSTSFFLAMLTCLRYIRGVRALRRLRSDRWSERHFSVERARLVALRVLVLTRLAAAREEPEPADAETIARAAAAIRPPLKSTLPGDDALLTSLLLRNKVARP